MQGTLTAKVHLHRFARQAGASVVPGAMVLDAGAGDSPYRTYFQHANYEATDHCVREVKHYSHVNYVCDLTSIPVASNRYDLVLCTQVLEHVPRPLEVVKELHRVLKPGGKLWISAPLYFEEHEEPHDFFRYTRYAWHYLMDQSGFQIEQLEWSGGYFCTLAYQLRMASQYLPKKPASYGGGLIGIGAATCCIVLRPVLALLAFMFGRLDLRHRYTDTGHCLDYCLVASKNK